MAEAHPTLVGTEVGHGDTTKMGANGRAHQDLRVHGVGQRGHGHLIEQGRGGESVCLSNLREGQSADENKLSVPRGLEGLTRGKLGDVELLVGITDVSGTGDHLLIDAGDDCLDTEHIAAQNETLQHVDLSSLDFIVLVLLVPESKMAVSWECS